ncbi:MAG: 50S ribosomal protein L24 [Bradymonadaceae bacterium]
MHVKTGDDVIILAGKDRGFTGEVLDVDPDAERVRVARCNMIVKHKQPDPFRDESGERVETEGWIDASNVAPYVEGEDGELRPVRVGHKYVGDAGELFDQKHQAEASFEAEAPEVIEKVRVARQTGDVIDSMPEY